MVRAVLVLCALVVGAPASQDEGVDPKAVDAAIEKGLKYLLGKFPANKIPQQKYTELVLLTLVHAGLKPEHPLLADNFNKMLADNLSETYNVGLRALLLEKVNRKYYQPALAEISMFFVESQREHGQWDYNGRSRKLPPMRYAPVPTGDKKKPPAAGTQTSDEGPPPGKDFKLPPAAKLNKSKAGDNSCTQYAILGFFGASRAAIVVPKETLERVEKWFESTQNKDGGWGYDRDGKDKNSTGSMTTAALTALIVAKFYQGKEWKDAPSVKQGIDWLGANFSVAANPKEGAKWHYYYLYGLERVGVISGMKELGGRNWYREGATFLLGAQQADGSWKGGGDSDEITDTCFAILFLKRATPELKKPKDIATGDIPKKDSPVPPDNK